MQEQLRFANRHGELLAGTLHHPDGDPLGGVVLGHCFTCSRHTGILRDLADALTTEGLAALRFDFSGNGQSEGAFDQSSYSKHIGEVETAGQLLSDRGAAWIGLAGHSMGASIAVLAAARMAEAKAVCAIAGRLSGLNPLLLFNREQQEELRRQKRVSFRSRGRNLSLSEDFFADAGQHDLTAAIAALRVPLRVVHGTQDEIIPVDDAYRAQQANPASVELDIVDAADHMFTDAARRRSLAESIAAWFRRLAVAQTGGGERPRAVSTL
jgi:putative redox protein